MYIMELGFYARQFNWGWLQNKSVIEFYDVINRVMCEEQACVHFNTSMRSQLFDFLLLMFLGR